MRKKMTIYLLFFVLMLFCFNENVYAAKKLTCVYEKIKSKNKVVLVQDASGKFTIYVNEKDADIDGKISGSTKKSAWHILENYKENSVFDDFSEDSVKYDKDGYLDSCPKSYENSIGVYYFFGTDYGDQKLISKESSNKKVTIPYLGGSSKKIPELTCVYEKKNGTKDVDKVVLTQDSMGGITIYKNSENVGIDSISNYWKKESPELKFDSSTKKEENGFLDQCPTSKTTTTGGQAIVSYGGLTFYKDKKECSTAADAKNKCMGASKLIESYDKVMDIQTDGSDRNVHVDYDQDTNYGKKCTDVNDEDKWLMGYDGYKLSCLYQKTTDSGCHIVQVNMGKNGVFAVDSNNTVVDTSAITEQQLLDYTSGEGNCPATVDVPFVTGNRYALDFSGNTNVHNLVKNEGAKGNHLGSGVKASSEFSYNIEFNEIEFNTCDDLFKDNPELLEGLKTLVSVVKILIPVILVVLGSLDFAQAVFASNEEGIKKAQSRFVKRLIIAVLIFLVPSILKLLLDIANDVWPNIDSNLCGII